jgi:hypothetical protein
MCLRISLIDLRRLFILFSQVNCGCGRRGMLQINLRLSLIDLRRLFILSRKVNYGYDRGGREGKKPSDIMLHAVVGLAAGILYHVLSILTRGGRGGAEFLEIKAVMTEIPSQIVLVKRNIKR